MVRDNNVKNGTLKLTTDGVTTTFKSVTSVTPTTALKYEMLKEMQGDDYVEISTGNQAPDTAEFTLKPVTEDEYEMVNDLFRDRSLKFDLTFVFNDGSSYSYINPRINTQPIHTSIEEGDASFEVKLAINCTSIVKSKAVVA